MSHISFIFTNISSTFGGQEKYLQILAEHLKASHSLKLEGGPPQLMTSFDSESSPSPLHGDPSGKMTCVHVLNGNAALFRNWHRSRRHNIRIYVQHSSFDDRQAGWGRRLTRAVLMRLAFRHVDAVIRVCDAALPASWTANTPLTTVYNGVDLNHFPAKSAAGFQSSPMRLLMVGSINANKNQRLAIQTLPLLSDATLTIVGDGPKKHELQVLAADLGVQDRVLWVDPQRSPARYYREAHVYLMLSHFEAMPFVVLEAMASGTPIVGFPVGGVGEVVRSGTDGILLTTRTPEALAKSLSKLASDPELMAAMGMNSRKRIESGFTATHMLDGFMAVVKQTIQAHAPSRVER